MLVRIGRLLARGSGAADGVNDSLSALRNEDDGVWIDFTDAVFGQSGHYGSAVVKITSSSETSMSAEQYGVMIDFADDTYGQNSGHYGSAYVKK